MSCEVSERKESEIHGKYQNQDVYLSRQTLREKTSKNVLLHKWRKLIYALFSRTK